MTYLLLSIWNRFRSPTGGGVLGCSGGARKSRVVSFNSAHQAQLIGVGGYNLAPRVIYFFHENPP